MIVPCGVTASMPESEAKLLYDKCQDIAKSLREAGQRSKADVRDNYSPGWKFNHWELKVGSVITHDYWTNHNFPYCYPSVLNELVLWSYG